MVQRGGRGSRALSCRAPCHRRSREGRLAGRCRWLPLPGRAPVPVAKAAAAAAALAPAAAAPALPAEWVA
eukprot:9262023-Pyramimonas_sp.AAC.1